MVVYFCRGMIDKTMIMDTKKKARTYRTKTTIRTSKRMEERRKERRKKRSL